MQERQTYHSDIPIVACDMDGHFIASEELASVAYYEGALEAFADDPHACQLIEQKLSPANGGAVWFSQHIMGHSHSEIREEINREFQLKNPLTAEDFKSRYMVLVDDKITAKLTPASVYDGIEPMLQELQSLRAQGKIDFIIISGSALKRIKESLINTGLMKYIDDFSAQVYSGEKDYKSKDELMTRLCTNQQGYIDLSRISYSGDGYGDAKSSNIAKLIKTKHDYDDKVLLDNVDGEKHIFFVGKSEGNHCVDGHKEKLRACGVDVMTTTSHGLHRATIDWLQSYFTREAKFAKLAEAYLARGSWQHLM